MTQPAANEASTPITFDPHDLRQAVDGVPFEMLERVRA